MKKIRRIEDCLTEDYFVKLDYQKPDGTWVCSHQITVTVRGTNKNHHVRAKEAAKRMFPGCTVTRVTYI